MTKKTPTTTPTKPTTSKEPTITPKKRGGRIRNIPRPKRTTVKR